jgi:hypothetical protein
MARAALAVKLLDYEKEAVAERKAGRTASWGARSGWRVFSPNAD